MMVALRPRHGDFAAMMSFFLTKNQKKIDQNQQ
jgi:hypothetical protein